MPFHAELILKGGTVVNHDGVGPARHCRLAEAASPASAPSRGAQAGAVVDCTGLHILPGVVDSQVHLREPGAEHKEDLETGGRAAVMGGVTGVFEMPNTNPLTTSAETLADKVRRATNRMYCDFAFYMGGTRENAHLLGELERLPGCAGIKVFMGSSTGSLLVEDDEGVASILANIRRRAAFHSEDEYRLNDAQAPARRGRSRRATMCGAMRRPHGCRTERLLRLARAAGKRIHVLHISTADEFPLLAASARRRHGGGAGQSPRLHLRGLCAARHPDPDEPAHPRAASPEGHLGCAQLRPRRRAGLRPCAAYAGGKGQALSGLALRHARRADAGARHARLREQGPARRSSASSTSPRTAPTASSAWRARAASPKAMTPTSPSST